MQFGKVAQVDGLDLTLPEDYPNPSVGSKQTDYQLYAGGTIWMPKSWKNSLYPKGTKAADAPGAYAKHFNTIELNATHYKIYGPEHLQKWRDQVPSTFRFCPKVPQIISHYRRLKNYEGPLNDFLVGIQAFDETLGPCFLQMPPNFTPNHFDTLAAFLRDWPVDVPLALELRHERWFSEKETLEKTIQLLQELGVGFVITDTAGRRDVLHMALTAPFLLLRFGGNEGHPSDETRLMSWIARFEQWKAKGLKEVYLLIHQPDSVYTPQTHQRFLELWKDRSQQ
ncbi:MAG: DUF72 domain-containing protein [Schleiferiaceae bacterium]|nr:DUF72 domain-containing protein [Schleiferiaceae bacterium]